MTIVGAPGRSFFASSRNNEGVYLFARNQGGADAWGQVIKLTSSDSAADLAFGTAVSISGDTAVVGAPFDSGQVVSSGAAYVFARNQGGPDAWGRVAKLTASDAEQLAEFGNSVSISGDTLIVGAFREDVTARDSGAAYVFARNQGGTNSWGQIDALTPDDAAAGNRFGSALAISDGTVLIGDDVGGDNGVAYVFQSGSSGVDGLLFQDGFEN